jgi:hypothetical protein
MWHINTMEYYSTKKESTNTWMNLEKIMLSGRIQAQKTRYHTIPFI